MQPFQCDLQPQIQETHRTTHTGTTTRCKTHRRNQSRPERPQPHPPHTRGTFHRRLQPLYTEKHKVSCSGFLPKTWPMQTVMQPFQCDLQPQIQETHRTTHTGTTTRCKTHRRNQSRPERPQPHPPHTRGTFHRRLQPLYTEKHKVSCSGFLPKTWPMQTVMQPFQCDLQPQLQETQRTTHTGTTTLCKTHRRNQSRPERPQPHPPHTRGTIHRRLQPLYTEKYKVSCSGFLPKPWPMQHSCSQSTAICNQKFQDTHRTTHIGTATRCRTQRRNQFAHETTPAAPTAHRRYLSSLPAATLHGKTQGFVLRLPPHSKAHATVMQPILRFAASRRKPARI